MKRFITAIFAALAVSFAAQAATTIPPSFITPTGSTAGQAIVSTGPTTAPAWASVSLSGVSGVLALVNGGTNANTASGARTNLGLGTAATANTGTSGATIPLLNGANTWSAAQAFSVRPTFNGATPWDGSNLASPAATTGNLSQFAATTSAQLAGVLSDETGTGISVFNNSPTIITPKIQGDTSGATVAAGYNGETIPNTPSTVSISSATNTNLASLPLTAGKWLIQGYTVYTAAAATTISNLAAGFGTTSATLPAAPYVAQLNATMTVATSSSLTIPTRLMTFTTATTVYAVGQVTFASGSCTQTTYIFAMRVP